MRQHGCASDGHIQGIELKNVMDATYVPAPAAGIAARLRSPQRRKLLEAFTEFIQEAPDGTILHAHAAAASLCAGPDGFAEWAASRSGARITSWEPTPETAQRPERPGLPFPDGAFDWVFCDEMIERVGSFERQYALLKELTRVARKGVFVTTSNRKHPMEFNTGLPLLHWLPPAWWRRMLKLTGKGAWAPVLNLLDSTTLYKLASLLPGKPASDVGHKRVFGIKAYFFLMIRKAPASAKPGSL